MSYERMMELHFEEADYDGSGRLEAAEWLEYLHKNKTYHSDAERDAVDKQRSVGEITFKVLKAAISES